MNETVTEATITIKTEPPNAGPRALRGALFCAMLVVCVVIGDVWWVGLAAAVDINARAFNPLPIRGSSTHSLGRAGL